MRYLVAGAAGFIGSHLCERLIADGHEVIGYDNQLTGSMRNLEPLRDETRFSYVKHDVTVPFTVRQCLDGVFNLASPASPKDYLAYPVETLAAGSEGTRNLLETARLHGARFLQASTSECYGDPQVHPQVETYWGNVNPVGPRSCYDESKRFGEALTMAYYRVYGLRTTIARIFNTYGPRMQLDDGRIVPVFVGEALRGEPITVYGDGSQTRSFCYVGDLVEGLVRLIDSGDPYPVNLGNPHEMTVRQFAEYIIAFTGAKSRIVNGPLPEDDPRRRKPDITRAKTVLGWEPHVSLEEGLRLTVDFFRGEVHGANIAAP